MENSTNQKMFNRYLGSKIRMYRIMKGWTQGTLADAVGISFQQIQKYETGINRISASRLFLVANKLGVPMNDFFDGVGQPQHFLEGKSTSIMLELFDSIQKLAKEEDRRLLRDVAKRLAVTA